DAGAERKDRLETRQAGEQPARRVPGAGIGNVGGIAEALWPQVDVALGRQRAHALLPGLRIEAGDSEEDGGHADGVSRSGRSSCARYCLRNLSTSSKN